MVSTRVEPGLNVAYRSKATSGASTIPEDEDCTPPVTPMSEKRGLLNSGAGVPRHNNSSGGHHHGWGDESASDTAGSSANSSVGNKSDTRLNARQLVKKYSSRVRPRMKLYILFAVVECFMTGIFFIGRYASHHAVIVNYMDAAQDALNGVHESYTKKIFQMRNVLTTLQYSQDMQDFIAVGGATAANVDKMDTLLQHIRNVYQVEFAMLLSTDFKIVASASQSDIGKEFNPQGILTEAKEHPDESVWTYGILKYEDYLSENPPQYRDRESTNHEMELTDCSCMYPASTAVWQAFKSALPSETMADSLIRWVAQALEEEHLGAAEEEQEPGEENIVGYCLIGDIVNGKAASTTLVAQTLGGLASVYHKRLNVNKELDDSQQTQWLTASSTANARISTRLNKVLTGQNMLVQGFSPYDALDDKDGYLDSAQARSDADTTVLTQEIHPYMTALRNWRPDDEVEPSEGRVPLALSRGVVVPTALTSEFMAMQFVRLAIIVMIDLLTLFIATVLFMAPLETMGKRIRAGQQLDLKFIKSLGKRRNAGVLLLAIAVYSVWLGFEMRNKCATNMQHLITARNQIEPGSLMLAYRQGMDQAQRTLTAMQMDSTLRSVLNDTTQETLVADLRTRFMHLESVLWVEMCMLYNAAGELVVVRNKDMQGKQWDPSGVVAETLSTGFTYSRTGLLFANELGDMGVERWDDRYFPSTPVSHLHVEQTGEQALVRWVSVPVWINGPGTTGPPDGVLVIGDIVNGKTRIVERANKMVNHGYTAIYMWNNTDQFQHVASVIRKENDKTLFDVDVPLPDTTWLTELRRSTAWQENDLASTTTKLHFSSYGGLYFVSAVCLNKNTFINSNGINIDEKDWHGYALRDCQAYLVQGLPWNKVIGRLLPCYTAQGFFVAMCCVKFAALAVLCYSAYRPFAKIVKNSKAIIYSHTEWICDTCKACQATHAGGGSTNSTYRQGQREVSCQNSRHTAASTLPARGTLSTRKAVLDGMKDH